MVDAVGLNHDPLIKESAALPTELSIQRQIESQFARINPIRFFFLPSTY